MDNVLAVILGGGRGTRLFPLTKLRAKPAVPIGGKYRLIDIPVSNCLNSDISQIFILTQFNSASLHRHIAESYVFGSIYRGFVEILAAQQTVEETSWYEGTADAVRKNLRFLDLPSVDTILVLSGDQLYRMDFREILKEHRATGAEITISAIPVGYDAASELGILKVNDEKRVVKFFEKPRTDDVKKELSVSVEFLRRVGVKDVTRRLLGSMGIYVFKKEVLRRLLEEYEEADFGKEIIPKAIDRFRVFAHFFEGYWEDIGTIRAFYEANLDLVSPVPKFNFFIETSPIYTRPRYLPPSKINKCTVTGSTIADGCIIEDSEIHHSVIGLRSIIRPGTKIYDSIIMGADFYEIPEQLRVDDLRGLPYIGIGPNALIRNAIVDKNAHIGEDARIENRENIEHFDGDNYFIRDGIVVVPKNASIRPGTVI